MPIPLPQIPLHKQDASAIGGISIWHLSSRETSHYAENFSDHRDDYYILMIVLKGSGTLHCDMETIYVKPKSIIVIKPYQVHSAAEISPDSEAYFISIAPFLMPVACDAIFKSLSIPQQLLTLPAPQLRSVLSTAELLHGAFTETHLYKATIMNGLFTALAHRIAALFSDSQQQDATHKNRAYLITQDFKALVSGFSFLHTPAFFAKKLHITPAHLNDCVKTVTGLAVSHFLQDAMILEAKRNLYYTNHDVKHIAYTLGFEDHRYFSRLFKKITCETPLAFRKKFRE